MFRWLTGKRLRTQLVFWTALILIVSVGITTEIRIRFNVRLLESDLQTRSETLIRAATRALELPTTPVQALQVPELENRLREFVEADPTLTRLDLVTNQGGIPSIIASSSTDRNPIVSAVPEMLASWITDDGSTRVMITTNRIMDTDYALIAVSSLQNIDNYEDFNRVMRPVFSAILILLCFSLMYIMYTRTVSARFDELLGGIRMAQEGKASRIPDDREDEIGTIAKTLNGLLARVHSFNAELQEQVAVATDTLNKRNEALEDTAREMLAMQEQLMRSQRLATVGQMAATFAHEIGSPMSSLSAHVQLLLEDGNLSESQRDTLDFVREEIRIVVQIVNELLRSARRGPSDFVPTDINETIRNVVRLVEPRLMSQNVELRVDLHAVPAIRGYALYIQEAFLNVINNALQSMPNGGQLEVRSSFDEVDELVNIRIADTGSGIDAAVANNLFDRFVTTKAIGEGAGLGLAVVKEIVDTHGGTVRIVSNDGQGTAALFTFPIESVELRAS